MFYPFVLTYRLRTKSKGSVFDRDDPTRIVSTDKKAAKAGGPCLALKGVPVKPTDDVNFTLPFSSSSTSVGSLFRPCPLYLLK